MASRSTAEDPTGDPEVNRLRDRQIRNFLATLLLSQGTPMMLAGDELARTQGGNNSAYSSKYGVTGRSLLVFEMQA